MKILYTLFILCLFLLNFRGNAQQKDKSNFLYTKITIPIWVDFIERTDNTNPKYEDYEKTWTNNRFDIYIDLPNIPIDAGRVHFQGKYTYDLMPFGTYDINGKVSDDRRMLQVLTIRKNVDYNNRGYEVTEKWTVTITDMPLTGEIGHWSKEKTKVRVDGYKYSEVTSSDSRIEYKDYVFKSVNEDKILEYPAGYSFRVNLNIDGPPSYTINVTDVRGPDPTWEPPAAKVNPNNFNHDVESNSLSFYANYEGLDDISKMWTKYFYWQTMFGLFNVHGLKVLERGELKPILREIDLSQSGLIREETKVNTGRLMKEEVAVITKMNTHLQTLEISIQSRKGEKKITVQNLTEQNRDYAFSAAQKEAIRIANSYLKDKPIPAPFYL
jgi:hypothetical protein